MKRLPLRWAAGIAMSVMLGGSMAACGSDVGDTSGIGGDDAGLDATRDAATADRVVPDAGQPDSPSADGSNADSTPTESGNGDTAAPPADAGAVDSGGSPDTGVVATPEAGPPDTGAGDSTIQDTGAADSAFDSTVADTGAPDVGLDSTVSDTGASDSRAESGVSDTGTDSTVGDTGAGDTGVDSGVADSPVDTGAGDTGSDGGALQCNEGPSGICTPTEAIIVAYDIAHGQNNQRLDGGASRGCYECMVQNGCLDSPAGFVQSQAITYLECGDPGTTLNPNGSAANVQNCLDALTCVLTATTGATGASPNGHCTNTIQPMSADPNAAVGNCYCGEANAGLPCLTAGVANGACAASEPTYLGSTDPTFINGHFTDPTIPGGVGNAIMNCAQTAMCDQCFR
jgi:hypothetical protein